MVPWYVLSVSSMKALDLVTMKKLDSKVNIIPVIAKADTVTKTELQKFKSKVGFFKSLLILALHTRIYLLEIRNF